MTDQAQKPFKTIDEQIEILKQRGLLFESEETAKNTLAHYGYYEIVNGYKDNFMIDPKNDERGFKPGTKFEHIYQLFNFDSQLRAGMMEALEDFEAVLRQHLAYVVSKDIGWKQTDYTDRRKYNTGKLAWNNRANRLTYPVDDLMSILKRVQKKKTEPYKHYRESNHNVPPWIVVKGIQFGSSIWWVRLLKGPEKTELISLMYGVPATVVSQSTAYSSMFGDLLDLYLDYRNTAAHGGRMYNHYSIDHELPYNPVLHGVIDITPADYRNNKGHSRYWVVVRSLLFFEGKSSFNKIFDKTLSQMAHYIMLYPDEIDYICKSMEVDKETHDKLKKIILDALKSKQ